MIKLDNQVAELLFKVAQMEADHDTEATKQVQHIQQLTDELKGIDHTYSDRLQ